jgi:hypothetical protein
MLETWTAEIARSHTQLPDMDFRETNEEGENERCRGALPIARTTQWFVCG